ncbi:MAG TPA: tetratricopeptide repeat protein [Verrucomicrobiae bacterium]|nr:tetratricopeptide repeat protein [Verrucomicrobiae bacterium]
MSNPACSEQSPKFGRETLAYLSVWVVALLLRMVYLWQIRRAPGFALLMGDAAVYDEWARQIANGNWLGSGVFYQAPLYPYFLGGLYAWFGRNLLAVRLVQVVIGACSCVLLAAAGRSFFKRSTGLLAGALLAVYPTAIFFDCSIQKSVLDLFLVCGLLAALGRVAERPRHRLWLGTGIVLGLLALTRENALVFVPIVLAWLFVRSCGDPWTKRWQWAGLLLLGLVMVLLPVGVRNLLVGGQFYLTTAQFGSTFYSGNGKEATGFYRPLPLGHAVAGSDREEATALAERAMGRRLTPSEVSHYWTARTLNEIRADVPHWLRLMWKKWLLVWNISEVGDTEDQYTYGDWSPLLRTLSRLLHFGILCPLAAFGVCLTWRQWKRLWLLYAMIPGFALSAIVSTMCSRYRFPLVPMLLLFVAAGLTYLRDVLRETRWRAIWTGLVTAAVAAVICNHPMLSEAVIRAGTHNSLGVYLIQAGRVQEGIEQYRQALRLMPDFADARINLADELQRTGQFKEAIGHYEQALRIKPNDPDAHNNLGIALARVGELNEAIERFQQALQIKPDFAEACNNLGLVLVHAGKIPEAISRYEQALRLRPDYPEAHCNLGVALEQAGRVQEAMGHYEQALRLEPGFVEARQRLARLRTGR